MNPIEGLIVGRYVNLPANTGYPHGIKRLDALARVREYLPTTTSAMH